MFLQTVANVFIYSLRTSYFYLCILILISIPEPFSSTQRTSFESLLLLLNSLAHWKHGGENEAAGSEAMSNAGCVLRYSPGQPPGQASQLVSRAVWACLCYSLVGCWENLSSEELEIAAFSFLYFTLCVMHISLLEWAVHILLYRGVSEYKEYSYWLSER